MSSERLQLLLPFAHAPGYDARDFLPAESNQEALAWLDASWPDRRLALWGPAGCGKSHLLHVWAEQTGARVLPGQALQDLNDVPERGALALDDADTVSPEPLLLHLLNTARDRRLYVRVVRPDGAVAMAGAPAGSVQPAAGHRGRRNPAAG